MKKILPSLLALLCVSFFLFKISQKNVVVAKTDLEVAPVTAAVTHWSLPEPTPLNLLAPLVSPSPTPGEVESGSTPTEVAQNYLDHHREDWHLAPYHEFHPTVYPSPLGATVRFSVTQGEIPVVNSSIEIHLNPDLTVATVKNDYQPIAEMDVSQAEGTSQDEILDRYKNQFEADSEEVWSEPVIVVPIGQKGTVKADLAYPLSVHYRARPDQHLTVLFRARDGAIVGQEAVRAEFPHR